MKRLDVYRVRRFEADAKDLARNLDSFASIYPKCPLSMRLRGLATRLELMAAGAKRAADAQ